MLSGTNSAKMRQYSFVVTIIGALIFLMIGIVEASKSGVNVLGSMWFFILLVLVLVPVLFGFMMPRVGVFIATLALGFAIAALFLYFGNGMHLSVLFGI